MKKKEIRFRCWIEIDGVKFFGPGPAELLEHIEQEGSIASDWGVSENHRRARFYRITRVGEKQLASEVSHWEQATEILARFLALKGGKA